MITSRLVALTAAFGLLLSGCASYGGHGDSCGGAFDVVNAATLGLAGRQIARHNGFSAGQSNLVAAVAGLTMFNHQRQNCYAAVAEQQAMQAAQAYARQQAELRNNRCEGVVRFINGHRVVDERHCRYVERYTPEPVPTLRY